MLNVKLPFLPKRSEIRVFENKRFEEKSVSFKKAFYLVFLSFRDSFLLVFFF